MWVRISTGDRSFCAGVGSPRTERRIATGVTMDTIKADGRTDSVADNFRVDIAQGSGVADLFWPPPVGATLVAYDDANAEIERGTIARIGISAESVSLQVQL